MIEIVVAGHLCLDIIPQLSSPSAVFAPGRMVQAGAATLATGGAVANVGLALHRLGGSVRLVGKIGADMFGEAVRAVIASESPALTAGLVVDPQAATSYTLIISPPGTDRMFIHCPGANDTFGAADLPLAALENARLLHLGYPPIMARLYADDGRELVTILSRAKHAQLTTALDLTLPDPTSPGGMVDWRVIFGNVLPHTDLFLPSVEEVLLLLRRSVHERLAAQGPIVDQVSPALLHDLSDELLALGARVVGLKLGHRGMYLRTARNLTGMGRAAPLELAAWQGQELWCPCYRVDVVGTTGAGDVTIAGLLLALLRGASPAAALNAGCAAGACSVEAADALSGVRDWDATAARVAAGWARLPLVVDAPGWGWDAAAGVWRG